MQTRLAKSKLRDSQNICAEKKTDLGKSSLHGHDFYELEIFIKGSDVMAINGKNAEIRHGCVVFASPEDFHSYTTNSPKTLYNIQFSEDATSSDILRRLTHRKQRIYHPAESDFEYICALAPMLISLDCADTANMSIATHILECILLILEKNAESQSFAADVESKDMQKALIYIHAHFRDNPSLSEVASLLPLNERYFCAKFKEYTGETYKSYLKMMKLRYARRLILATDLTISEIAEQSGYNTQSHFNREFRERYGIAPLEMRKKPRA